MWPTQEGEDEHLTQPEDGSEREPQPPDSSPLENTQR